MTHEIINAFNDANIPLRKTLAQMLDDHSSHCTDRRGCGFTQATRFLSTLINQPADPVSADDLTIFADWPMRATETLARQAISAGWDKGWRELHLAPKEIINDLPDTPLLIRLCNLTDFIDAITTSVNHAESKLFLQLLKDLILRPSQTIPCVTGMRTKPDIGSCSQAEEFFLEIAHSRIRRGGEVNIIVSDEGIPVMVEKINLGESHSAIVIAPIQIFGTLIPSGGLCALQYAEATHTYQKTKHGHIMPLSDIAEARFLRLTTLAVPPDIRHRTFTAQVDAQIRGQMLSPLITTIDQMYEFALTEMSSVTV